MATLGTIVIYFFLPTLLYFLNAQELKGGQSLLVRTVGLLLQPPNWYARGNCTAKQIIKVSLYNRGKERCMN